MTANWLLPRALLAALFLSGAAFAFFESIYLRDQYAEFHAPRMIDHAPRMTNHARRIAGWKWAFRAIAVGLSISSLAVFAR